jgi:hypothetical protein
MKLRNGFVSNSSSSSFLVMWDKKPETQEELKNILFGEKKAISETYSNAIFSTDELAQTLFRDLTEATDQTLREENYHYCSFWYNKYDWTLGYKTEEEERELMNDVETLMKSVYNKSRFDKHSELQDLEKEMNLEKIKLSIKRKRKYVEISNHDIIYTQDEKKYLDVFLFYEKIEKVEKEIDKIYDLLTDKSIKKIKEDFKNSFISIYEYGDNIYETGGLFDNIFHITTNRH